MPAGSAANSTESGAANSSSAGTRYRRALDAAPRCGYLGAPGRVDDQVWRLRYFWGVGEAHRDVELLRLVAEVKMIDVELAELQPKANASRTGSLERRRYAQLRDRRDLTARRLQALATAQS